MKKIILCLFSTFALLILSNVEGFGQCPTCPSPHTSQSVNHTLTTGPNAGCEITINYCLICHPTGNAESRLCSVTIPYTTDPFDPCFNMTLDANFWNEVRNAMVFNSAVVCGNIGPCPQRVVYETFQANCMELTIDWDVFPKFVLKPCPLAPGECRQEFEVCWEPTGFKFEPKGPPVLIDPGECSPGPINIDSYNPYTNCFNTCW